MCALTHLIIGAESLSVIMFIAILIRMFDLVLYFIGGLGCFGNARHLKTSPSCCHSRAIRRMPMLLRFRIVGIMIIYFRDLMFAGNPRIGRSCLNGVVVVVINDFVLVIVVFVIKISDCLICVNVVAINGMFMMFKD